MAESEIALRVIEINQIFRGVILILSTLGGILSIFLGWKLYLENVKSRTQIEATHPSSKLYIKVITAGPGLFFAAFGMIILVYIINMRANATTEINGEEGKVNQQVMNAFPDLGFISSAYARTPQTPQSRPQNHEIYCATSFKITVSQGNGDSSSYNINNKNDYRSFIDSSIDTVNNDVSHMSDIDDAHRKLKFFLTYISENSPR